MTTRGTCASPPAASTEDAPDMTAPRTRETIITDAMVAKGYYIAVPVALVQLLELKRLRPVDVSTYCVLFHHMTRRKGWRVEDGIKNGLSGAIPGIDRLMRMLGLADRNAVFASLARLEAAGIITRARRARKSNAFTITPVANWDLSRPAYRSPRVTPRSAPAPRFGGDLNGHHHLADDAVWDEDVTEGVF